MAKTLSLFEAFGIECEYMLVDKTTLKHLPISDKILTTLAGELTQEVELGEVAWSNELVLHVIELKANGPHKSLKALRKLFHDQVRNVNEVLAAHNAQLMPTAMHPFLAPDAGIDLWPHGDKIIYETYNKIFSCKGHGWSNLQSIHINLPFADDKEFGRLHAAIRIALPLLPALAASSPLVEGKFTGHPDNRLLFYRGNQAKVPSITGRVIPEDVFSHADYDQRIFQAMYKDIAPLDPDGVLQDEWLNSRGAIARFDRNAIEIRVIDIQECPSADFAIIGAVVSLVKALVDEKFISYEQQKLVSTEMLSNVFMNYIEGNGTSLLADMEYLKIFGIKEAQPYLSVWKELGKTLKAQNYQIADFYDGFTKICENGNLASRITKAIGSDTSNIAKVYQDLCKCLAKDTFFEA